MAIISSIFNKLIELRKSLPLKRRKNPPIKKQAATLKKLLRKARNTSFGLHYDFEYILSSKDHVRAFQRLVPIFDYSSLYKQWWQRAHLERNVCWPGKVKYFALSSGTSESASKHIPVTNDMLKAIKKTSLRQIADVASFGLPEGVLDRGFLMIGGSTQLYDRGSYFEGDLSGITTGNIPLWFQAFYKPGKEIAKERDWQTKIDKIVRSAKDWDISIICGVPAWIQIIIEKVIEYHKVDNIHDIWPNFTIFVHGGVSFEPYRQGFERLMGKKVMYIDTYLASEGFIAYQNNPESRSLELVLDNGIFMEFVPFNEKNFDENGDLVSNPETLLINEVENGKEYAILISTCSGAWRYLIGDTVKFTSVKNAEIIITGRTKHFLSLCGEHLSVDNMNQAVNLVAKELNASIPEFAVSGIKEGSLFAHEWFLASTDKLDEEKVKERLDHHLKTINDDYAVERKAALKNIHVNILPTDMFYEWMREKGKEGGQNKFPRVLKNHLYDDWKEFIQRNSEVKI